MHSPARVHGQVAGMSEMSGMYAATSVERAQNASKRCEYTSVSVDHYAPPAILGCMSISSFLSVLFLNICEFVLKVRRTNVDFSRLDCYTLPLLAEPYPLHLVW